MTFPIDFTTCPNCRFGEHDRCSALLRDVTCTCPDERCIAGRQRVRDMETRAKPAAAKKEPKPRLKGPKNDPRVAAHEQTATFTIPAFTIPATPPPEEPPPVLATLPEPTADDLAAIDAEDDEIAPLLPAQLDVPWQKLTCRPPGEWVDVGQLELRAFTVDGRIVVRARVVPAEAA